MITNSQNSAKDVVSDVFYNLWNSNTNLGEIRELKSYLFTAVKHQAIRTVSDNPLSFESFHHRLELKSVEHLNPEDLMIGNELAEKINETLATLGPQCQLVFKMVREESRKYDEVAEELGISVNTVKHHMVAALKKMRLSLEEYAADTPVYKLISSLVSISVVFKPLLQLV